ncbi:hypothetical protein QQG55_38235 [Brugia pahangi]
MLRLCGHSQEQLHRHISFQDFQYFTTILRNRTIEEANFYYVFEDQCKKKKRKFYRRNYYFRLIQCILTKTYGLSFNIPVKMNYLIPVIS